MRLNWLNPESLAKLVETALDVSTRANRPVALVAAVDDETKSKEYIGAAAVHILVLSNAQALAIEGYMKAEGLITLNVSGEDFDD